MVFKHLGLEDISRACFERMGSVEKILLVGDYAKGLDTGVIDIVLVGKTLNTEYIGALEDKIEN